MEFIISSQNGGKEPGRANFTCPENLSDQFRGEFLKMLNRGFSKKQISRDLHVQVAPHTFRKIIRHFQCYITLNA